MKITRHQGLHALPVAQLYPPEQRDALIRASEIDDPVLRFSTIDLITDTLVRLGYVRPAHEELARGLR